MASHATVLPLWRSPSDQPTASDVLPKPPGALITASRLAGSPDAKASRRGRSIRPGHRGGTTLVARKCFPPGTWPFRVASPLKKADCSSVKRLPLGTVPQSPVRGMGAGPDCTDCVEAEKDRAWMREAWSAAYNMRPLVGHTRRSVAI